MKKKTLIALILTVAVTICGCGAEAEKEDVPEKTITVSPPSVSSVLEERIAEEELSESSEEMTDSSDAEAEADIQESDNEAVLQNPAAIAPEDGPENEVVLSTIDGVDIDLTSLSSTVVYAQVYQMMYYPENFVGKTIRMEGIYSYYLDMASGKSYYGCIIQDATACCAQGVEFEPLDSYIYPDDYPEDGDLVVVEGVFDTYEEDGYTYCTLRSAKFI